MSIRFDQFNLSLPGGSFTGLIGHGESGIAEVLATVPEGVWTCPNLSALDTPARLAWLAEAEARRRAGGKVLAGSGDPEIFRNLADEVWWLEDGKLRERGDPGRLITDYLRSVYPREVALAPAMRRGDGRAAIEALEVLNSTDELASFVSSGERMAIRVRVRFEADVSDPVVGIMIRTRIGFEVYGTNTELEKLAVGPVRSGETRTVTFRFDCQLCPQSYTITAASHDPDGVWHEWLEDAISFTVSDTRYTAGVANLRAQAELS